ncbi:hypothetical protein PM082_006857 [Marasmius tenuissimus]|nr:hypothetical protein PM082_006857 [Marasmius tenuissimus]
MRFQTFVFSAIAIAIASGSTVTAIQTSNPRWPYNNQLFQEENLLYESSAVGGFTVNCTPRDSFTSVAAEWIRLAYHDMATHNVQGDGKGGIDGSIRYELDRGQNIGKGMVDSLRDFSGIQTPHVSMSDIIAMGTIFAYASCGGPTHAHIPFRAGRVDATSAGPPGVPEPQEDLQSHIENFKRQGFTQSEMIALVACGHALGGVRKAEFPTIVPGEEFGLFTGKKVYTRDVVTGYLDDTTPNPLVITPDVTMRSDLRIFASDGNVTMQRLAQSNNFDTECASLIERMIDTVPKDVKLTEPILPIEYKVGKVRLFPSNDGSNTLRLRTTLRTLDVNPNRKITLHWTDHEGTNTNTCPATGCSSSSTRTETISTNGGLGISNGFGFLGITASTYHFEATINSTSSISKFWFEIAEGDGTRKTLDNGGEGYVIDQDAVLFDPVRSGSGFLPGVGPATSISVAIKTSQVTSIPPTLVTFNPSTLSEAVPPFLPIYSTVDLALDTTMAPTAGYTFFSARLPDLGVRSFDVVFERQVKQEWVQTTEVVGRITPSGSS